MRRRCLASSSAPARPVLFSLPGETQCRTRRTLGHPRIVSAKPSSACVENGRRSPPSACFWSSSASRRSLFSLIATIVTVTLNGVLFLIAGAAEIGIGMHSREWGRFFLWVVGGLVYIAAGVLCIVNPVLASVVADAPPRRRPHRRRCGAGLSRDTASSRPSARPRLSRRRGDHPARFDHCEPLAARQRLCPRHPARRRPPVSRGWMGELRHGVAGARLSVSAPRRSSA